MSNELPNTVSHIALLVGNHKGGVGKTLTVQSVVTEADRRFGNGVVKLIQVDDQSLAENQGGSFAKRVDLSIRTSADLESIKTSGKAAVAHFDDLADLVLSENTVIDLGANTPAVVLEHWAMSSMPKLAAKYGTGFHVAAVTNGSVPSLEGALWLLENAEKVLSTQEGLYRRYFVVLNDSLGKGFEGAVYEELLALARKLGATIVRVPYSQSELLYEGQQRGLTPLDTFLAAETIGKETGLSKRIVRFERERIELTDFLCEVRDAVAPILPAALPGQDEEAA